jgi:hypothetical protein
MRVLTNFPEQSLTGLIVLLWFACYNHNSPIQKVYDNSSLHAHKLSGLAIIRKKKVEMKALFARCQCTYF